MTDNNQKPGETESAQTDPTGKSVSRREFLRMAGIAGAAVGVAGGLGGLLTACGDAEETTTTAGGVTTTAGATTTVGVTTTAGATTTVDAGPESGREVKIGIIAPVTGPLAVFAIANKWGLGLVERYLGDTWVLGDGKSHKVSWLLRDTTSDSNRTGQITSDLILNDAVDLLVVGGGPDTDLPAAVVAETMGCPLLAINCPWQAWVFGQGKDLGTIDKWTFGVLFGIEQASAGVVKVFDKITSNKTVSIFLPNSVDAQAWLSPDVGVVDTLKAAGYQIAPFSQYNPGTEDYSNLIAEYKKAAASSNSVPTREKTSKTTGTRLCSKATIRKPASRSSDSPPTKTR